MNILHQLISYPVDDSKEPLTVACSGGVDSIAIVAKLKKVYNFRNIRVFHFNHKIRSQNDKMEDAVRQFCRDFSIPLFSVQSGRKYVNEGSQEAFYRTQRYAAMAGLGKVVTGHHLNDAVESYMLNCLTGNPEYLPMPIKTDYKELNFTIVRPFLMVDKEELVAYAKEQDLMKYVVEDETNTDEKYRRNWLRNTLLPQIKEKQIGLEKIVKKRYLKFTK